MAMLDGRSDTSCTTPCSIDAAPGRHSVSVNLQGYQLESREVDVRSSPVEMPAIMLRSSGGMLMLTTVPAGASVLVNGKRIPQTTPARIPLATGTYSITVEKDGKQNTQKVEIGSGLSYLKIPL